MVALANLGNRSNSLLNLLQRYEHIVTNKIYSSRLARDQLLNNPIRGRLADAMSGLSMHMEYIAQKTMTIIAACNAVEEYKGSARGQQMATALLAKGGSHIPPPLRRELEAIASV